ncbi:putative transcriptional regulator [Clavispora lusitaniae]|uniref:Transcriptional regulator n=1 Tax=Clavispora lusitaniae TaxID=36911 RepID=A0AA91T244_CLALS|nr:putative transcriptional regulator [Clavispora lusitaniae]
MDSPQDVGDTTANSISNQLSTTHLHRPTETPVRATTKNNTPTVSKAGTAVASTVSAAVYSGQKFMQISVSLETGPDKPILVLRRVQDSYVNVSQMLEILVLTGHFSKDQVSGFLRNEILHSTQYLPRGNPTHLASFNDFRTHAVEQIRGLWIPYDKAVSIAVRFDLYELVKKLFLVDVHDFHKLHKPESVQSAAQKRPNEEDLGEVEGSPSKKRKALTESSDSLTVRLAAENNSNYPYCLAPLSFEENNIALISEVKLKFSEIFKTDGKDSVSFTIKDIEEQFKPLFSKCEPKAGSFTSILDVSLDSSGKTALHYASTLASTNLVASFIELKICSPIRGDNKGESPLISMIQVTNAMEKGNFTEILRNWLWPNLWLFDSKHKSIFHVLTSSASNNYKSSKFYLEKILEWAVSNENKEKNLFNISTKMINAQESENGNTALHLAGELELKWFVYLFLELRADPNLPNNTGVKASDFDCVKVVAEARDKCNANPDSLSAMKNLYETLGISDDSEEYMIQLVRTGVEFLNKSMHFAEVGEMEDEQEEEKRKELSPTSEVVSSSLLSNKIFKSIQDLLSSTNEEYEKVIHSKKAEINNLNRELRDATIITANNRFFSKKIAERISSVDTMKLQMANITDKLQTFKKNQSEEGDKDDVFSSDIEVSTLVKFDADEPFIIKPIYEKLIKGEAVEATPEILEALPSSGILSARLKAYNEVNSSLQQELNNLLDYNALTAKFKKVVSFCTGVGINEVDELLDGLLEAVEGQQ